MFVRSLRHSDTAEDSSFHVRTCSPYNYARWLRVHIRDMMLLEECHPEFKKGNFLVKNTQHAFSGISLDHAHEQNNKLVKGDG